MTAEVIGYSGSEVNTQNPSGKPINSQRQDDTRSTREMLQSNENVSKLQVPPSNTKEDLSLTTIAPSSVFGSWNNETNSVILNSVIISDITSTTSAGFAKSMSSHSIEEATESTISSVDTLLNGEKNSSTITALQSSVSMTSSSRSSQSFFPSDPFSSVSFSIQPSSMVTIFSLSSPKVSPSVTTTSSYFSLVSSSIALQKASSIELNLLSSSTISQVLSLSQLLPTLITTSTIVGSNIPVTSSTSSITSNSEIAISNAVTSTSSNSETSDDIIMSSVMPKSSNSAISSSTSIITSATSSASTNDTPSSSYDSSESSSPSSSSSFTPNTTPVLTDTTEYIKIVSTSTDKKYKYLFYLQEYDFTDSTTSLLTELPTFTKYPKTGSLVLPSIQPVVTEPMSVFKDWMAGSLEGPSSSVSEAHNNDKNNHKGVIIGSVLGSICGVGLCLFAVLFLIHRRRHKENIVKNPSSAGRMMDPFGNEFEFKERNEEKLERTPSLRTVYSMTTYSTFDNSIQDTENYTVNNESASSGSIRRTPQSYMTDSIYKRVEPLDGNGFFREII